MRRLEEIGDAIERFVINENGAQKGLLGLDVMGGAAIGFPGLDQRPRRDCHSRFLSSIVAFDAEHFGARPNQSGTTQ